MSLPKWNTKIQSAQRVVETVSLLADPEFTGGEEKEVELGMRIRGCGKVKGKLLSGCRLFSLQPCIQRFLTFDGLVYHGFE